jgi:hypothetical protein
MASFPLGGWRDKDFNPELNGLAAFYLQTQFFWRFKMESKLKAYAWFVGFMIVTAVVVRPIATQMGIPLLKDI